MATMTPSECREFLLAQLHTAKLATVRADGRPHIVPIWFDLEGEELIFTTGETTVKAANMRRDPRVSLCVDDEKPPFAYVVIEGHAELLADSDQLLYWATRIGGRYMGQDQAEAYGRRNAVPGELLVRVKLLKLKGSNDVAGW